MPASHTAMPKKPAAGLAMHGDPKYPSDFTHFDYVNPAAPKGGRLTLAVIGSFDSLNPFIVKGTAAAGREYIFESLLRRSQDEAFSLYPSLAQQVETLPDRSTATFTLDPRARFSDGHPVTAQDVIFSLETLRDKGRPNHRFYYSRVDRIELLPERRIRFHFQKLADGTTDRELPLIIGLMPILPEHVLTRRDFTETTLTSIPGSGPYMVETIDAGRSITYRRNPDYWAADLPANRGHFNFDEIRFDYYRDGDTAFEAFKAGLYDHRDERDSSLWANGYDFPAMLDGRVVREELPHSRPAGMYGMVFNTRRPLFDDREVRAALTGAFDFSWINKNLFYGAYVRTDSYFANSELAAPGLAPSSADDRASIRHRLKKIAAILRRRGWVLDDGILVRDGQEFKFEILLARRSEERLALHLARNLKKVGVVVDVRTVDSAQYEQRRAQYNYDMILYHWDQSLSPGNEQQFYWGSHGVTAPGTRNYAGINSPEIDGLTADITSAISRSGLISSVHKLDRALLGGHYVIPLFYQPSDRIAYWRHLVRPATTPLTGYRLETWWSGKTSQNSGVD